MQFLRRIWDRLKAAPQRTWLFGLAGVVVLLLAAGTAVYGWEYTNSPQFCGTTCHTMPPEYAAYQVSPHARVACVECHIGRTVVSNAVTRKAGDLMHVVRYASNQYTFPLYASTMQPSRESCEKCHWPEKFSDDKVVSLKDYEGDASNTPVTTLLMMKTGGGTQREGRGFGIHWHVENEVNFIALDPLKQTIPWIQVIDASGKETVYTDIEKPLTADEIAKAEKHRMDCIDCHNRISHTFRSPNQAIDQAITLNRIDSTIPFIHKKAIEVLGGKYASFDEANKAIEGLDLYYRQQYPDYYRKNSAQIKDAIAYLKKTYAELVFPTQDISWTTHPDNVGHENSPGCFRCHDGKHFTVDNKKAIRLECNICHTLPQVARAGSPAPVVSVARTDEPESHGTTTWLAEHRTTFNASCQQCHDTRNAGGKDNSSFCSNSACHGTKWTFAGLDAPAFAKVFPPPVPPRPQPGASPKKIPHPIGGSPDCQICHGSKSIVRPYPSDHVGLTNDTCLACHQPTIPPTQASLARSGPPQIPHDLAGRAECLGCHANAASGVTQVPQFHKDYEFPNTGCVNCHKSGLQTPSKGATTTPSPTAVKPTSVPTAQPKAEPPTSAGAALPLPASHAGRTACTVCHASGVGGAPKLPADHQGRQDATCTACHK